MEAIHQTRKTGTNKGFSSTNKKNEDNSFFSQKGRRPPFFGSVILQPKLRIGQPDDPYEKEADRIADQVMRMPDIGIQRKCTACEHEEEKVQRKSLIQLKASGQNTFQAAPSHVANKIASTRGSGSPLPKSVQHEMGSKMGADFSGVRVHTDNNAVQLSHDLGARAFTVGNNVYFNRGEYSPASGEGKSLIAHELVHTVQQQKEIEFRVGNVTVVQRESKESNEPDLKLARQNRVIFVNRLLGIVTPWIKILNYLGWTVNGLAGGYMISATAGKGALGEIGAEKLFFYDIAEQKFSSDRFPYAAVGIGIGAGGSFSLLAGYQLGPIEEVGGGSKYAGTAFGLAAQLGLGLGLTISEDLIYGREGWLVSSMSFGGEFEFSAKWSKSASANKFLNQLEREIDFLMNNLGLALPGHGSVLTGDMRNSAELDTDNLEKIIAEARNEKKGRMKVPNRGRAKNDEKVRYERKEGIIFYSFKPGDTLGAIARKFDVPGGWREIYNLNKQFISNPNNIEVGSVLVIPAPPRNELIIY